MNSNRTTPVTTSDLVEERLRSGVTHSPLYHRLAKWVQSHQLAYYVFGSNCCELFFDPATRNHSSFFKRVNTPAEANLLLIFGHISNKDGPRLKKVYDQLCNPKLVIAFGSCAADPSWSDQSSGPVISDILPIDFQIDKCPRQDQTDKIYPDIKKLWLDKKEFIKS